MKQDNLDFYHRVLFLSGELYNIIEGEAVKTYFSH